MSFEELPFKSEYLKSIAESDHLHWKEIFNSIKSSFESLPQDKKREVLPKLVDFSHRARGATWELYWWQILASQFADVKIDVPTQNGKNVDFKIEGTNSFILEATTIGIPGADMKLGQRQMEIHEFLEKNLQIPNVYIHLTFKSADQSQIRFQNILEIIQHAYLKNGSVSSKEIFYVPEYLYEEEGWSIGFRIVEIEEEVKFENLTPVLSQPLGKNLTLSQKLEEIIDAKIQKFRKDSSIPTIIAIGSDYGFLEISNFQILKSLFGEWLVRFDLRDEKDTQLIRPTGLYFTKYPEWAHLYGIAFQLNGFMGFGSETKPEIWLNPFYVGRKIPQNELFDCKLIGVIENSLSVSNHDERWEPFTL